MYILGISSVLILSFIYFCYKKIKNLERDIDKLITDKIKKEYLDLNK